MKPRHIKRIETTFHNPILQHCPACRTINEDPEKDFIHGPDCAAADVEPTPQEGWYFEETIYDETGVADEWYQSEPFASEAEALAGLNAHRGVRKSES